MEIGIETRVTNDLGTAQYSLFIDSERVDETEGTHGTFSWRGKLPPADGVHAKQVIVRIDQGVFSTQYVLEVDGETHEMAKS